MTGRATIGVLRRFSPGVLRAAMLAAVASGALLLLAACGEGEEKEASPAAPTATEEPREAAATAAPDETETAAGEVLYGLESFHYSIEMKASVEQAEEPAEFTIASEGDYVAPDRHAWSVSTDIGPISMEEAVVVIGESAWYRSAGEWRETTVDDPDVQDAIDFSTMDPGFFPNLEDIETLRWEEETLDGLKVRHYQVSEEDVDFLKSFTDTEDLEGIERFNMELWLASDGGWPVRIIFEGSATPEAMGMEGLGAPEGSLIDFSARFDVTQVNDPSLTVEPPI